MSPLLPAPSPSLPPTAHSLHRSDIPSASSSRTNMSIPSRCPDPAPQTNSTPASDRAPDTSTKIAAPAPPHLSIRLPSRKQYFPMTAYPLHPPRTTVPSPSAPPSHLQNPESSPARSPASSSRVTGTRSGSPPAPEMASRSEQTSSLVRPPESLT